MSITTNPTVDLLWYFPASIYEYEVWIFNFGSNVVTPPESDTKRAKVSERRWLAERKLSVVSNCAADVLVFRRSAAVVYRIIQFIFIYQLIQFYTRTHIKRKKVRFCKQLFIAKKKKLKKKTTSQLNTLLFNFLAISLHVNFTSNLSSQATFGQKQTKTVKFHHRLFSLTHTLPHNANWHDRLLIS